jgi:hypothetical protein
MTNCSGSLASCTGTAQVYGSEQWTQSMSVVDGYGRGECNCTTGTPLAGRRFCQNHGGGIFYIKVTRRTAGVTCSNYALVVRNG